MERKALEEEEVERKRQIVEGKILEVEVFKVVGRGGGGEVWLGGGGVSGGGGGGGGFGEELKERDLGGAL